MRARLRYFSPPRSLLQEEKSHKRVASMLRASHDIQARGAIKKRGGGSERKNGRVSLVEELGEQTSRDEMKRDKAD